MCIIQRLLKMCSQIRVILSMGNKPHGFCHTESVPPICNSVQVKVTNSYPKRAGRQESS